MFVAQIELQAWPKHLTSSSPFLPRLILSFKHILESDSQGLNPPVNERRWSPGPGGKTTRPCTLGQLGCQFRTKVHAAVSQTARPWRPHPLASRVVVMILPPSCRIAPEQTPQQPTNQTPDTRINWGVDLPNRYSFVSTPLRSSTQLDHQ